EERGAVAPLAGLAETTECRGAPKNENIAGPVLPQRLITLWGGYSCPCSQRLQYRSACSPSSLHGCSSARSQRSRLRSGRRLSPGRASITAAARCPAPVRLSPG